MNEAHTHKPVSTCVPTWTDSVWGGNYPIRCWILLKQESTERMKEMNLLSCDSFVLKLIYFIRIQYIDAFIQINPVYLFSEHFIEFFKKIFDIERPTVATYPSMHSIWICVLWDETYISSTPSVIVTIYNIQCKCRQLVFKHKD